MPKVLCITGMHRSGTSLTASWLEGCGLTIHNGNLIEAKSSNPKGHFEDMDFVNLHSSMINNFQPNSHGWKIFTKENLLFDKSHLSRAFQIVSERNNSSNVWGWKDPRTTLFLEEWKSIIPEMKTILLWRKSLPVVQSLLRRAKQSNNNILSITMFNAYRLWSTQNKAVISYRKKFSEDSILLSIQDVLENDKQVIKLIEEKLNIDLVFLPIKNFYEPTLLHTPKINIISYLLSKLFHTQEIECELEQASDIKAKKT